jgi:hypothetical protein
MGILLKSLLHTVLSLYALRSTRYDIRLAYPMLKRPGGCASVIIHNVIKSFSHNTF